MARGRGRSTGRHFRNAAYFKSPKVTDLVKEIQRSLGVEDDGLWGRNTNQAFTLQLAELQTFLHHQGAYDNDKTLADNADGYLGQETLKALQNFKGNLPEHMRNFARLLPQAHEMGIASYRATRGHTLHYTPRTRTELTEFNQAIERGRALGMKAADSDSFPGDDSNKADTDVGANADAVLAESSTSTGIRFRGNPPFGNIAGNLNTFIERLMLPNSDGDGRGVSVREVLAGQYNTDGKTRTSFLNPPIVDTNEATHNTLPYTFALSRIYSDIELYNLSKEQVAVLAIAAVRHGTSGTAENIIKTMEEAKTWLQNPHNRAALGLEPIQPKAAPTAPSP